jgi:hypothetical protein
MGTIQTVSRKSSPELIGETGRTQGSEGWLPGN